MRRALSKSPVLRGLAPTVSLLALLLGGCFVQRQTTNEPLVPDRVRALEPGRSTSEDVVALLGAPTEVVQLARRSAYRYEFSQRKTAGFTVLVLTLLNSDLRSDRLWVFFDEEGLLSHVAATFEGEDARYAMPWMRVHERDAPPPEQARASGERAPSADDSRP